MIDSLSTPGIILDSDYKDLRVRVEMKISLLMPAIAADGPSGADPVSGHHRGRLPHSIPGNSGMLLLWFLVWPSI